MRPVVKIENIEEMRRCEGVEDIELCRQIHQLVAGDVVRLTFLSGGGLFPGEMVPVRITSVKGTVFRGKLLKRPTSSRLAALRVGAAVTFAIANIHSIVSALDRCRLTADLSGDHSMLTQTLPGAGTPSAGDNPMVAVWQNAPPDREELLRRIGALGDRITTYVAFMVQASTNGASAEAKDKALAVFYEKLLVVERQLARVHDAFRLE